MSRDKAEYFSGWQTRVLPARRNWPCDHCGGTIRKGSKYLNHKNDPKGTWQGRQHIDCQAAWWQVAMDHLLESVGNLPHRAPPEDAVVPALEGIPVAIQAETDTIGSFIWNLPPEFRQRLLHTPDLELRESAITDIGLVVGLMLDGIIRVAGQKEASMMMSNVVQQMHQVAATAAMNQRIAQLREEET